MTIEFRNNFARAEMLGHDLFRILLRQMQRQGPDWRPDYFASSISIFSKKDIAVGIDTNLAGNCHGLAGDFLNTEILVNQGTRRGSA